MRALGDRDARRRRARSRSCPQRLENVRVPTARRSPAPTGLWEAVGREGAGLEGRGRVLVRPSGTEPLVRVMVEAPDEAECEAVLGRLVEVARRELGDTRLSYPCVSAAGAALAFLPRPSCAASSDTWAGGPVAIF